MKMITRVRGTAKGGCDVQIGAKTLIYGPVGAGKTRIVNTMELALVGEASNVGSKAMASVGTELITLAPVGKDLEAQVVFDDDTTGSYLLARGREKKVKGKNQVSTSRTFNPPIGIDPESVLPLSFLRASMTSADAARKFFLKYAVGEVTEKDIMARIPEELHGLYKDAVSGCPMTASQIDHLLYALADALKRSNENKSAAETTMANAEAQAVGLAAPTEAQLAAAKEAVGKAQADLEAASAAHHATGAKAQAEVGIEEARKRWEGARAAVEHHKQRIADIMQRKEALPAYVPLSALITKAVDATRAHAEAQVPKCVTCGFDVCSPRGDNAVVAKTPAEHWARRLELAMAKIGETQSIAARHAKAEQVLANAQIDLSTAEREVVNAQQEVGRWEKMLAGFQSSLGQGTGLTIEEARVTLQLREAELARLQAAEQAWASTKSLRSSALENKDKANKWVQLADACKEAVKVLLDAGVEEFERKVQFYLPAKMKFALQLHDSLGRDACRYGIRRGGKDGEIHTAISEGEKAQIICAMASVVTNQIGADGKVPYGLIVPPDCSLDPKTLEMVLRQFGTMPQQVVITSTTMPTKVPRGWTVVQVGAGKGDGGEAEGTEEAEVEEAQGGSAAISGPTPSTSSPLTN